MCLKEAQCACFFLSLFAFLPPFSLFCFESQQRTDGRVCELESRLSFPLLLLRPLSFSPGMEKEEEGTAAAAFVPSPPPSLFPHFDHRLGSFAVSCFRDLTKKETRRLEGAEEKEKTTGRRRADFKPLQSQRPD